MKKIAVLMLALMMVCSCAMADVSVGTKLEVANCNEYISLRLGADTHEEVIAQLPLGYEAVCLGAAENGFLLLGTPYGYGYALEKYLEPVEETMSGRTIGDELTANERYNINLFLSNFTEADFCWGKGYFDHDDERQLIDFAINHIWFNQQDKLEFLEDISEYNTRLKKETVLPVIKKYFGIDVKSMEPTWAEIHGDYYCWTETGGHVASGFAQETSVVDLGDGTYDVWFSVLGSGWGWTNECCGYTLDEARAAYPDAYEMCGYARIQASDLSDRATFTLKEYACGR